MEIADYLLETAGLDWEALLAPWQDELPPEFQLWLVNRFAEPFIVDPGGKVTLLRLDDGKLEPLADSRDAFLNVVDDHVEDWFLAPLVSRMAEAGAVLAPGRCFGFIHPPIMGGAYDVSNVQVVALDQYYRFTHNVFEQTRHLPDGTHVRLLPRRTKVR